MTDEEFRNQAQKMGYNDEFVEDTIESHNNDKFILPYEEELLGMIDNYPHEIANN